MSAMGHPGDLIEFLRARLDDDCAVIADPSVPGYESCQLSNGPRREYWNKERALAEVDSKRHILDWCARIDPPYGLGGILAGQARRILRWLALPYAGHADYRPEWAPQ
jgi:hypothetical protein